VVRCAALQGSFYEGAEEQFKRQLILLPTNAPTAALTPRLAKQLDAAVGLSALQVSHLPAASAAAFWQTDVTASRKKLQPLLAAFFDGLDAAL
jgi:hypothetical protein